MLKQRNEQIQFVVRMLDAIICIIAFFAAAQLRFSSILFSTESKNDSLESVTWMLAASLTIHFILYPILGFYTSLRLKTLPQIITMVFKGLVIEIFFLGGLVFFLQAKSTSRWFFGFFLAINYSLVLIERLITRIGLSTIRRRGYNFRKVLIVGTGQNARRVIGILNKNKHWGYVPFGLVKDSNENLNEIDFGEIPILGNLSELTTLTRNYAVDEIFFALDEISSSKISESVALCEAVGIPARFSLGLFDLPQSRVTFSDLDHLPVLTFYTTLMTPMQAGLKRVTDIIVALFGLIITAALYPWIAWNIRRQSPGPVIFKQVRVGENGRRFKCYKFRTMYVDAEQRKNEIISKNRMEGPLFKIENDPRITPFGAFLRKSSLDELPQFFNILRGDMSVVGTRPPTPDEVLQYATHYRRRLSIRPGLTGLWQVSGRNNIRKFDEVLALDLQYIDRWSLWLDLKIIFRTILVTVFRRGAY